MSNVTYTEVKPLIEGLKDTGRTILLAVISYLVTEGVMNTLIGVIFGDKLSPELILIISGLITSILKGIDKDIHLTGKLEGNDTLTRGLTQF